MKITTGDPPKGDVYVVAVPTQHIGATLKPVRKALDDSKPFVSLAKGIEQKTLRRPTEVIAKAVKAKTTAVRANCPMRQPRWTGCRPTVPMRAGAGLQVTISVPGSACSC